MMQHVLIEKPMACSTAECEELIALGKQQGKVVMVGHTFLYSPPVQKVVEIIRNGDIGEIRYINCRRLNLGLFQKDINVAWDLAPHDIAIILHILGETPTMINCQGNAHVTPGIEDVTNMSLSCAARAAAMPAKVHELDALIDQFLSETGATFPRPNPAYRAGSTPTSAGEGRRESTPSAAKRKKKAG